MSYPNDQDHIDGISHNVAFGKLNTKQPIGSSFDIHAVGVNQQRSFTIEEITDPLSETFGGYIYFGGKFTNPLPIKVNMTCKRPDGTYMAIGSLPITIPTPSSQGYSYWNYYWVGVWFTGPPYDATMPGVYELIMTFAGEPMTGSYTFYFEVTGAVPLFGAKITSYSSSPAIINKGDVSTMNFGVASTTSTRQNIQVQLNLKKPNGGIYEKAWKYFTVGPNESGASSYSITETLDLPLAIRWLIASGQTPPAGTYTPLYDSGWIENVITEKPAVPSLPDFWSLYQDALSLLMPEASLAQLVALVKAFDLLYYELFDVHVTSSTAFNIINDWLLPLDSLSKFYYGTNLIGQPSSIGGEDYFNVALLLLFAPETKVAGVEAKVVAKEGSRALEKILATIVSNYDKLIARGVNKDVAAKYAEKLAYEEILLKVAADKPILTKIINTFTNWKYILSVYAAAVTYDGIVSWGGLDNVATAAAFNAGQDYKLLTSNVITKEKALSNLENWNLAIDVAVKQTQTSKYWNILNILFGKIWAPAVNAQISEYNNYKELINNYVGLNITKGTLEVITNPLGANVYIDGVKRGTTPFSQEMIIGMYTVSVELFGYASITKQFIVDTNQISTMNEVLQKEVSPPPIQPVVPVVPAPGMPTISTGFLIVNCNVMGADVYLDGIKRGITPFNQEAGVGNYTLAVSSFGYDTKTQTITISGGINTVINITLEKPAGAPTIPADKSYISINTSPIGASVLIDDVVQDYLTPVRIEVLPGLHTVLLRKINYDDYLTSVTVEKGKVAIISITLSAVIPVPPSPLPPQIQLWKLTISSVPSGAKILINGSILEKGGFTIYTPDYVILQNGNYSITVSKYGYDIPSPVLVTLPPS